MRGENIVNASGLQSEPFSYIDRSVLNRSEKKTGVTNTQVFVSLSPLSEPQVRSGHLAGRPIGLPSKPSRKPGKEKKGQPGLV